MHANNCFDASTYERMVAGQLPAAELEKVCRHLETCARCLQVVQNLPEDTLVASMRDRKWPANVVEPAFVRGLAHKVLKKAENRGQELASFVVVSCPGCRGKLKVKREFVALPPPHTTPCNESAGQKVKCPRCGQVMQIPAMPVAKFAPNTVPPKDVRSPDVADAPTVPPVDARTIAPVDKDDTKLANKPDATHGVDFKNDRSLTDFLAPAQQPDEIGRLGIYRVLKVLGAGGMGVVFKAEDPGLKRLVAIKAMLPAIAASASAKTRFLREAQAAAGIKHSHIVTIHQVSEDRGVPFLAMEFLEGESLDDRLKREPTLPPAEVLRIGREMAEGIAAAHERGLIHRDIKPANTWLEASPGHKSGEYHVKILDFGLARPTDDQAHLTQSGAIIGTPAYMAPEQARGEKLDARCDLWSLGVVLYRMCTGDLPFKGTDTVSTLMAVAMHNPPPPAKVNPAVPAGLSNLVMKLLEKDRGKRLGSARELVEPLRQMEHGAQATHAKADPGSSSPSRFKTLARFVGKLAGRAITLGGAAGLDAVRTLKRRPRRSLLTVCALVLLIALGYWGFQIVIVRDKEGNEIARVKVPKDGSFEVAPYKGAEGGKKEGEGSKKEIKYTRDFSFLDNQYGLKVKSFGEGPSGFEGLEGFEGLVGLEGVVEFGRDLPKIQIDELSGALYRNGLRLVFFDQDNVDFGQGSFLVRKKGDITGMKGDAFQLSVPPLQRDFLTKVKKISVRPTYDAYAVDADLSPSESNATILLHSFGGNHGLGDAYITFTKGLVDPSSVKLKMPFAGVTVQGKDNRVTISTRLADPGSFDVEVGALGGKKGAVIKVHLKAPPNAKKENVKNDPYAELFGFPTKSALDQNVSGVPRLSAFQEQSLVELRKVHEPEIKGLDVQITQQAQQGKNAQAALVHLEYRRRKLVRLIERKRNAVPTAAQATVLGINQIAIPHYATEKALNDPKIWDVSQLEKLFAIESRSFDAGDQVISFTVITKTKWTEAERAMDSKNWGDWNSPTPGKVQVRFYNKDDEFDFAASPQVTPSNPSEWGLMKSPGKLTDKQAEQGMLRWRITINLEAIRGASDGLAATEKRIAAAKFVYPPPN